MLRRTGLFFLFLVVLLGGARPTQAETPLPQTADWIRLSVIDVGQGDSILVEDSSGFVFLVDGGKAAQDATVLAYLASEGIDALDAVVVTHADADHSGGLIGVMEADLPVGAFYYSGYPGSTQTWNNLAAAVAGDGLTLTPAQAGDMFTWGVMTIQVLNPLPGLSNPETNAASVVLRIKLGAAAILLTGDIPSSVETSMIARGEPLAATTVLKVAHHGSSSSTSAAFLAASTPTWAVISVGNNSYGHPAADTLARLADAGAFLRRTDLDGTVVFRCTISGCEVPGMSRVYLPWLWKSG